VEFNLLVCKEVNAQEIDLESTSVAKSVLWFGRLSIGETWSKYLYILKRAL
jgi:hypothetical protein